MNEKEHIRQNGESWLETCDRICDPKRAHMYRDEERWVPMRHLYSACGVSPLNESLVARDMKECLVRHGWEVRYIQKPEGGRVLSALPPRIGSTSARRRAYRESRSFLINNASGRAIVGRKALEALPEEDHVKFFRELEGYDFGRVEIGVLRLPSDGQVGKFIASHRNEIELEMIQVFNSEVIIRMK